MAQVLKLPAYRRLLLAYGLTEIAWTVVSLALAILVYRRTGSAIGSAGFFLCAQFVPAFVSPAVVARVDRRAPRQVLPGLFLLEAVLFALLAWLVGRVAVGWILALAFADGVIALVARSLARAATVGVTTSAGLLREGNALSNNVFSLCMLAGPALGGLIVAVAGLQVALLVGSGIVLLIALALATARGLPEALPEDAPAQHRLASALRYVREQPTIRALLVLEAVALVFFSLSIPVEVVLAQHTLHAGASGYGTLLTTWGGGAIAGSLLYARWRRRSSWLLYALGAAGLAVGFLIMGTSHSLVMAAVGSAVGGAGNGIESVAAQTALQELVKPAWMALVLSLNESVGHALPGVGILLGGVVAQMDGPRATFVLAAVGSVGITAAIWLVLRPSAAPADSAAAKPAALGPLAFEGPPEGGVC